MVELLLLLSAGGLGFWAILAEPARETYSDWTEDQQSQARAAAQQRKQRQLERIETDLGHLEARSRDPRLSLSDNLALEDEASDLELLRDQVLSEELVPWE